ncbi:MAG: hypothetical protein J1F12_06425 [Muribaculaceae bacterium]|nr:hypothetical protein [Muribaculaceae bacterium]
MDEELTHCFCFHKTIGKQGRQKTAANPLLQTMMHFSHGALICFGSAATIIHSPLPEIFLDKKYPLFGLNAHEIESLSLFEALKSKHLFFTYAI